MENMAAPDILALDIVDITKIYSQWQRTGQVRDILRNLIHPQKKEIKALEGLSLQVRQGEFAAYAGAKYYQVY